MGTETFPWQILNFMHTACIYSAQEIGEGIGKDPRQVQSFLEIAAKEGLVSEQDGRFQKLRRKPKRRSGQQLDWLKVR